MSFFETSTRNLLNHEAAAGVKHHVALSVVGTDRLSESGYFRAKIVQEKLIKNETVPYTIVQATQFLDRKSTRLNSSHANISYAVFCLKKKNTSSPPLTPTKQP